MRQASGAEATHRPALKLLDADGSALPDVEDGASVQTRAGAQTPVTLSTTLRSPHLWSADIPYMYTL